MVREQRNRSGVALWAAVVVALGATLSTLSTSVARADVPGPRTVCDAENKGCTVCWKSYGGSPDGGSPGDECAKEALAKGLVESCSNRQGAGQNVYYCPAGQKVGTKVVGGCGGCAMPGAEGQDSQLALGMIAVGIGVLVSRATRRSRPEN